MIARLVAELGPWSWMVLGMALLAVEIVAPGFFLLWIGLAALIVGALTLALWNSGLWPWEVQVVLFLALSLLTVFVGRRIMAGRRGDSDQPLLNQRGAQLIGRTATLSEPIHEGKGRIQLGDTVWRVSGPDMPVGARVRVVSASDSELNVTSV